MDSVPRTDLIYRNPVLAGERKSVSVLFSDLSGYTALAERLDPEQVQGLLSQLLGETAQVVAEYEGHIERFLGDAVMAVFGIPRVHEDDPARAILAAQEIERRAERIVVPYAAGVGLALRMHSAIATGFVVHGDLGPQEGGQTVLGDTVNVAARLTGHAGPGEIVVSETTYELTCGHFDFESLGAIAVRGRSEPVIAYRVTGTRPEPVAVRRVTGMRADFVGRRRELIRLHAAMGRVLDGKPEFISVVGGPGTGKSRLVDEFRQSIANLDLKWRVAQCHQHSQRMPYAALKDFLGRDWGVGAHDPPSRIQKAIEVRVERSGSDEAAVARLGRLWGIDHPLLSGVDPEAWRAGLYEDVLRLMETLAAEGPSVLLFEDVHWADRQSLEVLSYVLGHADAPVLTVCTSRGLSALAALLSTTDAEFANRVIRLNDLGPDDSVEMCRSLLRCEELPDGLEEFVRGELGGNPFYVEEMVNSLVGNGVLARDGGDWFVAKELTGAGVPLTVTEVVEARVDRLRPHTKRIAQEASLMGRAFSADVLRRSTVYPSELDDALAELAESNLVRAPGKESDVDPKDWIFWHGLVQEAIASGLLSEERAEIHERIARALEEVHEGHTADVSEIIGRHFTQGRSPELAIPHLIAAAESCMDRYAVEEADARYREAYAICRTRAAEEGGTCSTLIDLICGWARVSYYMGDCLALDKLLGEHYDDAMASSEVGLRATYEFWYGNTLWHRERLREAERHLQNALALAGPPLADENLMALANGELAYTYADLGLLDEAKQHADEACRLAVVCREDYFVWQSAFGAQAYLGWCLGEPERASLAAHSLLEHADEYGNVRCLAFGHWAMALANLVDGDLRGASEEDEKALSVSADPWLLQFPKFFMAICSIKAGDFPKARDQLEDLVAYAEDRGATTLAVPARGLLGAALAGCGEADRGFAMLEESERVLREDERTWAQLNAIYIMGQLHAFVAQGEAGRDLRTVLHNPRFALGHGIRAKQLAQSYLSRAIEGARELGSSGLAGECWLALAEMNAAKRQTEDAIRCYEEALACFAACGALGRCSRVAEARDRVGVAV
jgi:class 3 adenylate cyclase/tetratricopeptide (TPR) repeat protein